MERVPPVLRLLLLAGLFLQKAEPSCPSDNNTSECNITVQATTSSISVSGLPNGFTVQNITDASGNAVPTSNGSYNNISSIIFVPGTQYTIYYGNTTTNCCYNFTTKPLVVTSLSVGNKTTSSVTLSWSSLDYQSSYTYRVLTNVTSSLINSTTVTNTPATITNLTPGGMYTFTVYTVAADNVTLSDPMTISDCTFPAQTPAVTVRNNQSVNSLAVNWTTPAGNVSSYNVSVMGDVNNTIQTTSTQVTFTSLLPGRNYTITVQTNSGSCSSAITTASEATYPTPPGMITFNAIGTNSTTLSWGEAANMTNVEKSYNITYWKSSSPSAIAGSTTSTTANVTLQNLTSGTNYTISVVTVGVRGYQSTAVTGWVVTKPLVVTSLRVGNKTTSSVTLSWSSLDYQSSYTYRVLTYVTSSLINTTTVTNTSATITNLIPGGTYTFTVYTVAADNVTLSDPLAITDCTIPAQTPAVTVRNNQSVNSLAVSWTTSAGNVSSYNVSVMGDVNNTIQTTSTQATFTSLLPGRNYTITVQTNSGSYSSAITTASEATYPTPPGMITFNAVGTNSTTLSWGEAANMTNVAKSYNITYWKSSSPSAIAGSTTSTTTNVTLQNLTSGTNYTFSVVTVGVRGYHSTAVTGWVVTKPLVVTPLSVGNKTTSSVTLSWSSLDYQSSYTYRVLTNVTSLIISTTVTNTSTTITNLTPGGTYTFTVYTVAADNVTLSDPLAITDCTIPAQTPAVTVRNNQSVNSLAVNWTTPAGNVSSYNVSVTGDVNNTIQVTSTQVTFTSLLPGRNYTITVQTNSGSCSSAITTASEATYPTPPGMITFNAVGTNSTTLSWGEAANMTNVAKSYNITYWKSSSPSAIAGSTTSTTTNVTLQNLTSGTNYTISVVTVGVRGYQSTAVTGWVVTKPLVVTSLIVGNKTTSSVTLSWSSLDYQSSYTYRVLTNVTSSLINSTTVTNTSTTITNLTPGGTYTFTVYTVAADNVTLSDSLAISDCTIPAQTPAVTVRNYQSVNYLAVNWTTPAGNVSSYNVSVTGDVNNTIQTASTQQTFTSLLPGRNYTITVQTNSGSCSSAFSTASEATYPTPPGMITFNAVGTNSTTLSWGEPTNMAGVTAKSYQITYWIASSIAGSTTSTTTNVILQNLTSGTNYTISVVTVGVRGYQSTAVTGWVVTKPLPVQNLQPVNVTSNMVTLNWAKPPEYQNLYSYRVQTYVTSSSTLQNTTIVTSESATIMNLTSGETYTFYVYTRAADGVTESDAATTGTCTGLGQISSITLNNYNSTSIIGVIWMLPPGRVSNYNVRLTGEVNSSSQSVSNSITQTNFTGLSPGRLYTVTIQAVSGNCSLTSTSVQEATYPTPPGNISFTTVGAKNVTLSWGNPENMSGATKTYTITYWNSSSSSNMANITIQNLISGTNYIFSVVTVAAKNYQSSSSVSNSIYTKPLPVKSPLITARNTSSVSLSWTRPDEYQNSYSYRVQTNVTSSSMFISNTTVTRESATITGLTSGTIYTITVYTKAGDGVTEADPVSIFVYTQPQPVKSPLITARNTSSVSLSWTRPDEYQNSYSYRVQTNVTSSSMFISNTTVTSESATITGLTSGTLYTITVYTRAADGVTEADPVSIFVYTQPLPVKSPQITARDTSSVSLSWTRPDGYQSSYSYRVQTNVTSSSVSNTTVTRESATITSLTSGTIYAITVYTRAADGVTEADPVSISTCTQPLPVKSPQITARDTSSVSLSWTRPDGYQSSYSYRLQTNVASSSVFISNITVTSESATVTALIPGETYAFTVYTRATDGVTESDPVSISTCTVPGKAANVTVDSSGSVNSLVVNWTAPAGKVSYYIINITGDVNNTTQTNNTQTIFTGLSPGSNYTITIQTFSGTCSSDITTVINATFPGQAAGITVDSYRSVNSLVVNWTAPAGRVSYYIISLTGNVNNTTQTNNTQINFTGLSPGREYTVTIQTVSGNFGSNITTATNATYPTPPSSLAFVTINTHNMTISWGDPDSMSGVSKNYSITYGNSSTLSLGSPAVLPNLISGTNYSIVVVTVGVRGYLSTPVSIHGFTKPMPVTSLTSSQVTVSSVPLSWGKPDEYQATYTYRVKTISPVTSEHIDDTIVTTESATISRLTPGRTYQFSVYTRAADTTAESSPVTLSVCTVPETPSSIAANSFGSVDSLMVSWMTSGDVGYYIVTITDEKNSTKRTSNKQANFTGLFPGTEYTVTIQTVSGSCSSDIATVTNATYPSLPGSLSYPDIGTHNFTLSWGEPADMTGVMKLYLITYWNSSSPSTTWSVTSDTTGVTLQNLTSGTSYTISVVTVGVRGYQSTAVPGLVYTKPMLVTSLTSSQVTVSSVPLSWAKPAEYQATYTYRVQTNNTTTSEHINDTIVTTESATISGLTPGRTYLFSVYTRAADTTTESSPVTLKVCTVPASVSDFVKLSSDSQSCLLSWKCPDGDFASFTFGVVGSSSAPQPVIRSSCSNGMQQYNLTGLHPNVNYTISITTGSCDRSSVAMSDTCRTAISAPVSPTVTPPTVSPPKYNQIPYTFYEFDSTNGPIAAYAIIVSSDSNVANTPPKSSVLSETYSNFKSKSTTQYVALIKDMSGGSRRVARDAAKTVNVVIGDGSGKDPYINGPLNAMSSYCVAVSGFTQINYNSDGTINSSTSLYTITEYSSPISTPQDPGVIAGAVVGTILAVLVIVAVGLLIWWKRRKGGTKKEPTAFSDMRSTKRTPQALTTASFIRHFDNQKADSNLGFSEEFEKLGRVGTRMPKTAAEHPDNREKNRYTNVLPYDTSRVTLHHNGDSTGDYINANFIPGYNSTKEFIAAQGPLPRTVTDFWRMIWEKEVRVIIMLTKCVEVGRVKCEEYWPSSSSKMYGNLSVSMTSENVDPDWTIRDFIVTNTKSTQTKQVRHFHFTAWPDHGVPRTTKDLIRFRNLIREYTTFRCPASSPILVHCSAGVGRTGTLIALDRIIKQIETEDKVDVYGTVYDLRMHRGLMVQTESQYIFLNQCALDIIQERRNPPPESPESLYQNLSPIYQNVG
ncbi:receptor-type tyrosine-protein phosphatase beta-like [Hyperolius riggenbachi]|uniref:receptor-type tyrosine-protein phosphatase beta-like n=1 Tax=Hyperolius riggenbachi TaxID=752182 RepID=UPI0035A3259F